MRGFAWRSERLMLTWQMWPFRISINLRTDRVVTFTLKAIWMLQAASLFVPFYDRLGV
jgi:hypothetical protein